MVQVYSSLVIWLIPEMDVIMLKKKKGRFFISFRKSFIHMHVVFLAEILRGIIFEILHPRNYLLLLPAKGRIT
jgi:hypothetical protein